MCSNVREFVCYNCYNFNYNNHKTNVMSAVNEKTTMHNIMTGGITFNVGYNPGNKYAYDCEGNDIAWQTGKTWVVTSNIIS